MARAPSRAVLKAASAHFISGPRDERLIHASGLCRGPRRHENNTARRYWRIDETIRPAAPPHVLHERDGSCRGSADVYRGSNIGGGRAVETARGPLPDRAGVPPARGHLHEFHQLPPLQPAHARVGGLHRVHGRSRDQRLDHAWQHHHPGGAAGERSVRLLGWGEPDLLRRCRAAARGDFGHTVHQAGPDPGEPDHGAGLPQHQQGRREPVREGAELRRAGISTSTRWPRKRARSRTSTS